jgi:hypothetical protein
MLAALALAGAETYSESATYCPAPLSQWEHRVGKYCADYVEHRSLRVGVIAVIAVAMVIAGVVVWRRGSISDTPGRLPTSTATKLMRGGIGLLVPVVAGAAALAVVVFASKDVFISGAEVMFALVPAGIAAGVLMTAALAGAVGPWRQRLEGQHTAFAAAMAYPLSVLIAADLNTDGGTDGGLADPGWDANHFAYIGIPLAVMLVLACRRQDTGPEGMPTSVSLTTLLVSTAFVFVAIAPHLFSPEFEVTGDQPLGRYLTFMAVAVCVPYVAALTWHVRQRATKRLMAV